ncbi:exodeoxyribonuclease V subunit gamma [Imhoffiella purpurea]|uniref:RecBCD enzyme subunit RecC n=1 Tax=Imhoffiella purpurea TaxID=1249627 RepID=W9VBA0_9GAMM|nr:exodeoxyribonuclease V subunit gamma [Imhoffiella purpurea]EXJ16724.1 Exodeoxyribonuclease V gamma chain [Imhoffiella purpurea]
MSLRTDEWPTGFMLIQGNRLELLRSLMVTWMKRYPLAPLEDELVLVQSNGIAQWLRLALAADPSEDETGGCGIAAAMRIMLPGRFVWEAYRAVLGDLPDSSPFDKRPLTWRLYRLLGTLDPDGGWQAPLTGFLDGDEDARRRHQLAARLADLFDQYQVYRADWLDAWERGQDILIRPNGERPAIDPAQRWQPALWRALRDDIASDPDLGDGPFDRASRAAVHLRFLEAAPSFEDPGDGERLPRRVILFGVSSMPRQSLEVLEAIAGRSQVMLFVHNPSRHYWGDIVEGRELFRRAYRRSAARKVPEDLDEDLLHLHGHPLLAAWGKQGRDYIRLLDEHDRRESYESHFRAQSLEIDLFESPGESSLLRQLQGDILDLRPLQERRESDTRIDPDADRSLEFLVAHGPQREMEILQDQLLDAFERSARTGRPLQPREVLVMVPNIDTYAPHIQAVFGRLEPGDPRFVPFHISDQGLRHRNPLLIGLETLLRLPGSRFAVSELLDLLDIPALRARFCIEESDLPRLRAWVAGANIRWGLDARQRAALDLPEGLEQNSWRFGLARMLLGFASAGAGPWRGVEPYDEIGGLEAALLGPLSRLLETLEHYWTELQQARRPAEWAALIGRLLADAFAETGDPDALAIAQVQQALEHWEDACRQGGATGEDLPLEVVREALLGEIDQPALSQRFLAGAINFATLMPMRAIPFRHIWLLGMNDGDYPRSRRPADFDLMADDYRPGDRSRREDDRYLFLEALLSARERLVIGWVGRSIRDNSVRPPSVLVGQLRDHIAAAWRTPGGSGEDLLEALTTEHPLQPFSRRYFEPGRDPRLFTYAGEWRLVHEERPSDIEPPPSLDTPILDAPVRLQTLGRFLRHPVASFYRQRLALHFTEPGEGAEDEETFALTALQNWDLQNRLIQSVASRLHRDPDIPVETALERDMGRLARAGHLPLPPFDAAWIQSLTEHLRDPVARYQALLRDYPEPCPSRRLLLERPGIRLEDSLDDLRRNADGRCILVQLQASRLHAGDDLKWHHLVRHWPTHLAAQLEGPVVTRLLGPETDLALDPLPVETARALLEDLLDAYLQGMTTLQPLACRTGFALLRSQEGKSANPTAVYEGGFNQAGEIDDHPGYARFWPNYGRLSAGPIFETLIDRLYRPLFEHPSLDPATRTEVNPT